MKRVQSVELHGIFQIETAHKALMLTRPHSLQTRDIGQYAKFLSESLARQLADQAPEDSSFVLSTTDSHLVPDVILGLEQIEKDPAQSDIDVLAAGALVEVLLERQIDRQQRDQTNRP